MMKNLDLENLDLEPHDREVKISISSRKLKKVSRRSVLQGPLFQNIDWVEWLIALNAVLDGCRHSIVAQLTGPN